MKPAPQSRTADAPCWLWIYRFDADGRATPGDAGDIARLNGAGEGFVWLHLDLADNRTRPLIAQAGALTEDARALFLEPADHQFLELDESLVFGAILDHELALSGRTSQTDYLRFAAGPGFFISARRRPMYAAEATKLVISRGAKTVESPLALLELLVEQLCTELSRMIGEIATTLDRVEDMIIEGYGLDERVTLGAARRGAVRVARQVGGLNSGLLRLEGVAEEPQHEELREALSRLAQHADALARDISSIQERARLLQDEMNAVLNLETNDRLYMLTVVTTLLLPATFVTGYFGMNTKQLLFFESDNGTLYATILCFLASALVLIFMRRLGLTRRANAGSRSPRADTGPTGPEAD